MSRKPRSVLIANQSEDGWDRACTIRLVLLIVAFAGLTALAINGNPKSQLATICYTVWIVGAVALASSSYQKRGKRK